MKQQRSFTHMLSPDEIFDLDNHYQSFWQLIDRSIYRNMSDSWLSWAQQSISSLARISAGQCLKYCDNTPSNIMPRVMGLSSSEDRMIVAGVVLTWYQRVTDGQTVGRSDRIYHG